MILRRQEVVYVEQTLSVQWRNNVTKGPGAEIHHSPVSPHPPFSNAQFLPQTTWHNDHNNEGSAFDMGLLSKRGGICILMLHKWGYQTTSLFNGNVLRHQTAARQQLAAPRPTAMKLHACLCRSHPSSNPNSFLQSSMQTEYFSMDMKYLDETFTTSISESNKLQYFGINTPSQYCTLLYVSLMNWSSRQESSGWSGNTPTQNITCWGKTDQFRTCDREVYFFLLLPQFKTVPPPTYLNPS